MRHAHSFYGYHPAINFLYFGLVLAWAMFAMHPVYLAISLLCAFAYSVHLRGRKTLRLSLLVVLPMMLLAAIVNPAFSHEGITILAYLPSGNPLTLESIAYGIAAAVMLASVILWFTCVNEVITSDKFVYLFGRIVPAMSLVLSMTLRFIPRLTAQFKATADAQRNTGRDVSNGSLVQRAKAAVAVLSIVITWSLENAIETADSMKSRGYGLPGRTAFSLYRFDERDRLMLTWLAFCGLYSLSGWMTGAVAFRYYPAMEGMAWTPFSASFPLVYLALCATPMLLDLWERQKLDTWNEPMPHAAKTERGGES